MQRARSTMPGASGLHRRLVLADLARALPDLPDPARLRAAFNEARGDA